jgi:hypothetical protein
MRFRVGKRCALRRTFGSTEGNVSCTEAFSAGGRRGVSCRGARKRLPELESGNALPRWMSRNTFHGRVRQARASARRCVGNAHTRNPLPKEGCARERQGAGAVTVMPCTSTAARAAKAKWEASFGQPPRGRDELSPLRLVSCVSARGRTRRAGVEPFFGFGGRVPCAWQRVAGEFLAAHARGRVQQRRCLPQAGQQHGGGLGESGALVVGFGVGRGCWGKGFCGYSVRRHRGLTYRFLCSGARLVLLPPGGRRFLTSSLRRAGLRRDALEPERNFSVGRGMREVAGMYGECGAECSLNNCHFLRKWRRASANLRLS